MLIFYNKADRLVITSKLKKKSTSIGRSSVNLKMISKFTNALVECLSEKLFLETEISPVSHFNKFNQQVSARCKTC